MATDFPSRAFADMSTLLAGQAAQLGNHPALVLDNRTLNYAELNQAADRVAAALQRDGIRPRDAVAFCARMSIEYVTALLGALRAGATVVPLQTTLRPQTLAQMMSDCSARLLFLDELNGVRLRKLERIDALRVALDNSDAGEPWQRWLAAPGTVPQPVVITPRSRFAIIYSSGTTGTPKGVVQSHGMRWAGMAAAPALGFDTRTVTLVSTPLYSNNTLVTLLPTLAHGGRVVLMPTFDPRGFLELSVQHQVTHAMLVPTQYQRILALPEFDRYDLSSYRWKFATGEHFPPALKAEVVRRWPGELAEFYGLTEGGGNTLLLASHYPDKLHTVGQPVPGHSIRIVDDKGREVPVGEPGEIVGRAPGVMDGYLNRQRESIDLEWRDAAGYVYLRSGDMGKFDAQGFLTLLERKKDLIISGGFKIYPSDLEGVLIVHEEVADVAVVGVPSAEWGETPVAFVVLRTAGRISADSLRAWADARLGKVQRLADLVLLPELPRSPVGKVLRRKLRDGWLAQQRRRG
ncbi:MAG TPA: class I adenylate-forming enzyme family protein [Nevskiaceae bacterium]|nr:class I adenylate-forming enzyme family protein [Nevskiaceae bacterium]